jgi:NADP-dependent 3-hydroxy acid dehydrogenase YdfG
LIVGNGHGIGLVLTKRLLGDDNDVVGGSRHFLDPICDRHTRHVLEVLDPGFRELIAKIVAEKSPIDTLVYCAGIGEPFETSGVDRDGDTIRVNVAALADAVRAVLPSMRARESGRIIGVSSIGDRASPTAPGYSGDDLSARAARSLAQIGGAGERRSLRICRYQNGKGVEWSGRAHPRPGVNCQRGERRIGAPHAT